MIGVPDTRVDELLTLVGLDKSAARKRVRQYSLGMRQRLGLAHALLGDPEVLILDEPANGLDPEGIRWMRGLLRDFADRGGTVLLSSHLLMEVEAVADQLLIIGNGRIVADGSREELLAGTGMLVRAHRRRRARRRAASPPTSPTSTSRTAPSSSTPRPRRSAAPRSRARSSSPTSARRKAPASRPSSSSSPRSPHDRFLPAPDVRRAAQDGRHPRRLLAAAGDRAADARRADAVLHLRRDRGPDLPRRVRARDPARAASCCRSSASCS